jgi:hypothetical protein
MPAVNFGQKYETARERLFLLLCDLAWHTHRECDQASGNRYTARMLELRRLGYAIDSEPIAEGEGKRYRLVSLERTKPQTKRVKIFLEEDDAQQIVLGEITLGAHAATKRALRSFRANKDKL